MLVWFMCSVEFEIQLTKFKYIFSVLITVNLILDVVTSSLACFQTHLNFYTT